MNTTRKLQSGDFAPWFKAPALEGSPAYTFDSVAGRYVLMLFFGSANFEGSSTALALVQRHRRLFDDSRACFFGVSIDPQDVQQERIKKQIPGIRFFLDYDREVSALYGASSSGRYDPFWVLLDPALRVLGTYSITDGAQALRSLDEHLQQPFVDNAWAPVLLVPNVFEPQMCNHLIKLYEKQGSEVSGFMRDVGGTTVHVLDATHKRRRDHIIEDRTLQQALLARIRRRLLPSVRRSLQFEATRIERYIVACYEAGAGHFRPHRDNTTKGTAHRRFAVTINLNGEYEGGDLRFPEFGPRTYRAPVGGAIVFSCSLLHEATPVLAGRRFAFLPFLYDEAGAAVRAANNASLADASRHYRTN